MRSRSNSGVRLDYYQRVIKKTLLNYQNPATGLIPASLSNSHAWIRDNVYAILSVWGLSLAYRKNADLDEDRAKAYELEQSVVKLMRGILRCLMIQTDKLEHYKRNQHPMHAFHAKFDSNTCKTVVGDHDWGHLQLDATSLFILMLAQMTASGLRMIFTLDEVAFVQNLIFYIETAYRTPDFGIWERGDKTNHGVPELNSSSIGMAKAALDAVNELDLFGSRGGPNSVIHVLPDESHMCEAILESMLPRESSSKETDAALLGIISYPAFAVDDCGLVEMTKKTVLEKLAGNYGCCRFLRDGYNTPVENRHRLYYEPGELHYFENIECEWPLMFSYLAIDEIFRNNKEKAHFYMSKVEKLMVKSEDGSLLMPEIYRVPLSKVDLERAHPGSQVREPIGMLPHRWGQSLYILGKLLLEGFISPGEIDPLNRRLVSEAKPDVVVQVVILAENVPIQEKLAHSGIDVQTVHDVGPIEVYPAQSLGHIYTSLGRNHRLHLSGRTTNSVGLLATSKLYLLDNQLFAFFPQFVDQSSFYLALDTNFFTDTFGNSIEFLASNWKMLGRPVILFPVVSTMLEGDSFHSSLINTIKKIQTGYINGTRVLLGNLMDFKTTSCINSLDFIRNAENASKYESTDLDILRDLIGHSLAPSSPRCRLMRGHGGKMLIRGVSSFVSGIVRRTRSIQADPSDAFNDSSSPSPSVVSQIQATGHLKPGLSFTGLYSRRSFKNLTESNPTLHNDEESIKELVNSLCKTDNSQDQADILHYLCICKGLDWDTQLDSRGPCTVRDLLTELYEKAGHSKQWWLVRHTAGLLKKRVEGLTVAVTGLLVRQKQLSIGLPPEPREKIITRPLPPDELVNIIFDACGEDRTAAALTQEILIYLAMFIRTEPKLFHEMLRVRVGLILQVMASELSRTLKCSGDDASDHLLNLSPFEMKTLLHHILSGKEFVIINERELDDEYRLSVRDIANKSRRLSFHRSMHLKSEMAGQEKIPPPPEDDVAERQGQWLRRRRLDGALNRTPVGFYAGVWNVLHRSAHIVIEGSTLNQMLTKEMTTHELKFALQVEVVLNRIPQPEYRQLMVEALMVIINLTEADQFRTYLPQLIHVDHLVKAANSLFIDENKISDEVLKTTEGAAGISLFFYDTGPSGRFGTMAYLCKALAKSLQLSGTLDSSECCVS